MYYFWKVLSVKIKIHDLNSVIQFVITNTHGIPRIKKI